jgi:antitoxin component of RelBE/YafQ-DinJ toxin-antitoxin module
MITQMVFKLDNKLKHAAQQRAKKQGIALSDLYKQATESFVAGELAVTFAPTLEIPNTRTARILRQITKDVKAGKNLSPAFSNAEDAIQYLENYVRRSKHRN